MIHSDPPRTPKDHRPAILSIAGLGLAAYSGFRLHFQARLALGFDEALSWIRMIPLRCPLNFLTGLDCPLCGLGRSLLALAWGDWSKAWTYHPLGPVLACVSLVALLFYLASPLLFRAATQMLKGFWRRLNPAWKYLGLGLYIFIFLLRNV